MNVSKHNFKMYEIVIYIVSVPTF